MQASDTAYPRFKNSFNDGELERWYTPTPEEHAFCAQLVRGKNTQLGFLLTLKSFQRLGYFVTSDQIPDAIIGHLSKTESVGVDREALTRYDVSRSRKTHMGQIRRYLGVNPFNGAADQLLCQALANAALTKDDLADIVNVGIEMLVKYRYELPTFGTLLRQAKAQRATTYQTLFLGVFEQLCDTDCAVLDALFTVGDGTRTSPWNNLKVDAPKATLGGLRELLTRYER